MNKVSIIVRSHNEEKWIGKCIESIRDQTVSDIELVLVDNRSTDKTVEKALNINPDTKVVQIEDYLPGKALNKGIRASSGEFFVCLSAHCIPVGERWLESLIKGFSDDENVAGVYGRQLPIESSDPIDKRDLLRTFGPERRVQTQDTFFHNANSIVRREVWEEYPFDDEVSNIEDQIWAGEVLDEGYKLVYEPGAAVYHYHGINQGNDKKRMRNVVRTMENNAVRSKDDPATDLNANPFDPDESDIVSFIPVRQRSDAGVDMNDRLIKETIKAVRKTEYIDDIYVATDAEDVAANVPEWGASNAIMRPPRLSAQGVEVIEVFNYALEQLEANNRYPDLLVTVDITHPFRPPGFLDDIIMHLVKNGHDTVIPVYPERRPSWIESAGELQRLNEATVRSERNPVHVGLFSLGTVMHPHVLRKQNRLAGDVGIYEIENPLAAIEIRERDDLRYWQKLRELPDILDGK